MKKLLLYTLAIIVPIFAMAQQTDTLDSSTTTMLKWGAIKVRSFPTNAKVFIDDTYVGRTPLKMSVPAGEHKLDIRKRNAIDTCITKHINIIEGDLYKEKTILDDCRYCIAPMVTGGYSLIIGVGNPYGALSFRVFGGVEFYGRLSIGLGMGLTFQPNDNFIKKYDGIYPARPWFAVPMGARIQFTFPGRVCAPYLALEAGWNLSRKFEIECDSETTIRYRTIGPFITPQFGFRIIDWLEAAIGYQYYQIPKFTTPECYHNLQNAGIHAITLNFYIFMGCAGGS